MKKKSILFAAMLLIFSLNGLFAFRYYDPQIARWTTVDPADEFHSPYIYCHNDPINFVDPDGALEMNSDNTSEVFTEFGETNISHVGDSDTMYPVKYGCLYTDGGDFEIEAYQGSSIRTSMNTDCHGYTFSEGRFWINNNQVYNILAGDDYNMFSQVDAVAGDVIIYRSSETVLLFTR